MKMIYKILMTALLISCSSGIKNIPQDNIQKEISQIVDEIVRYRLNRVSVVQTMTMPVFKTHPIYPDYMDTNDYPPPPVPPDMVYLTEDFFLGLKERELIDSMDYHYIYSTIDSSFVYNLDSTIITKATVPKPYLDSLFENNDNAYDYLYDKFGTSCFIRVGTPIFNQTRTRLVLVIDYYCGFLYGQGYIFILKKYNNKWQIIEELGTWES